MNALSGAPLNPRSGGAPLLGLSGRIYGLMFVLFPAELRRRRHDEAVELFRDLYRENYARAGWGGLVRLWVRASVNLLRHGLGARREQLVLRLAAWRDRSRAERKALHPPLPAFEQRPGDGFMEKIANDFRYTARGFLRNPGFALITVVVLGLGIGANTAVFGLVNGVVLNPLPYPNAGRLVYLDHSAPGVNLESDLGMAPGAYLHYAERSETLEEIGAYTTFDETLTGEGEPERILVTATLSSFFRVLQVQPLLGRVLAEEDDAPNAPRVAILTHGLWRQRYGGDPDIIGRNIHLGGIPLEVVGVMAEGFYFPDEQSLLWYNNRIDWEGFGGFYMKSVARMKPGVSVIDVKRDLDARIAEFPEVFSFPMLVQLITDSHLASLPVPLRQHLLGDIERALWVLLTTVGFVLLIACTNVANLFLVRAEARHREVAVRSALGAGRGQLARYFMMESSVLSLLGGVFGLGLALIGIRLLVAATPFEIPRLGEVGIDATVLAFTAGISLLASLLFGLIPVFGAGSQLMAALNEGGRGATAGRRRFRSRQLLVAVQTALAVMLLVGAGLMVRSFWELKRIDPGFDAGSVLSFRIGLPGSDFPDAASAANFQQELLDRFAALPGVQSAGAARFLPLVGFAEGDVIVTEGHEIDPGSLPPVAQINRVTGNYFETMKIALVAGRTIEHVDLGRQVAVINEKMAEIYWPGEDPLGRRFHQDPTEENPVWSTVVGVVANTRQTTLTDDPVPVVYLPMLSVADPTDPRSSYQRGSAHTMSFLLRTAVPPLSLVGTVRDTVRDMNPNLPIADVRTLDQRVAEAGAPMAFTMVLLGLAAGIAMVLGSVGIYGVVSYIVRRRTGEIGVRMALGARAEDVSHMVVRQGAIVSVIGLAVGLAGSLALTRLMGALLYGVSPTDPATYAGVGLLLFAVTLTATYLPARRAASIDPVEALRAE